MVSKLIEIVRKYKYELMCTLTLGLTFNFNVSFNISGDITLDFRTFVIVYLGYRILQKQFTKKTLK